MLVNIGISSDEPFLMSEMEIVHGFFNSFKNDDLEIKWGIKNNKKGERMSILTICTIDCQ